MKVLERKMGLAGYAIHLKMQEILGTQDYYEIDYAQPYIKESLLSEIGCTEEQWDQYLEIALDLKLLKKKRNKLFSPGLKKVLGVLDRKRELDRRDKLHKNKKIELPESEGFSNRKPPENSPKTFENTPKTPSKAEQSKAEKSKVNKQNTLHSSFVEGGNGKTTAGLLQLPFENTFDCLCFILAEYDRAKGEKAKQARRIKAESLIQKYSEDHVKDKLFHFLWVARYKPALLGDKPTGYLIESIEKPYPPPAGYEEWQQEILKAKRKNEKTVELAKPWEKNL
jgi:hypothetical protein